MTIKLLSYNIRFGGTGREAQLARVIRAIDPDIVVFQEATHPQVIEQLAHTTGLPVWAANFVLSTYGTGAIFGSPAGDQRDLDFANKYGLPFKPVVLPPGAEPKTHAITTEAFTGEGVTYNS